MKTLKVNKVKVLNKAVDYKDWISKNSKSSRKYEDLGLGCPKLYHITKGVNAYCLAVDIAEAAYNKHLANQWLRFLRGDLEEWWRVVAI